MWDTYNVTFEEPIEFLELIAIIVGFDQKIPSILKFLLQKVCVAVIHKHCIANGTMNLSFIYQDLCHRMLLDCMAVAVNGLRFVTPIFAGNET